MRSFTGVLLLLSSVLTTVNSKLVLPPTFAPPAVFRNINLLRSIDLTKPYSKEVIAVIVKNVSKEGQSEYFVPFAADEVTKVSFVEARDKKGPLGEFKVDEVEFNLQRCVMGWSLRCLFADVELELIWRLAQSDTILPHPLHRTSRARKPDHPPSSHRQDHRRQARPRRDRAGRKAIP